MRALLGCNVSGGRLVQQGASTAAASVAAATMASPQRLALACPSGHDLRTELKIAASIVALRDLCKEEIDQAISSWKLSPARSDGVFATMIADRSAPYGSSKSLQLVDLLADAALDCDNYVLVADCLLEALRPVATMTYVGFEGAAVGNHAEAFFEDGALPSSSIRQSGSPP